MRTIKIHICFKQFFSEPVRTRNEFSSSSGLSVEKNYRHCRCRTTVIQFQTGLCGSLYLSMNVSGVNCLSQQDGNLAGYFSVTVFTEKQ